MANESVVTQTPSSEVSDAGMEKTDERDSTAGNVEKIKTGTSKSDSTSKNVSEEKVSSHIGSEAVKREKKDASYVGWKQIGNWEEKDTLTLEDELLDLNRDTILDNFLPDKYYGDWYHSAGIIFLGGFLSFAIGYFKFNLAPVFIIVLLTAILYRTSTKKYRGSIRELVQKEFTVQKIENDYESLEWLNTFLDKYWPRAEPAISQMIVQQVNEILATQPQIPAFIKAIWIDQLTLGVKPPRIDLVKTFQNTESDVVVMDWGVSFTPHDLSDMNAKQMRNYVNQKVVLKAKMFGLTIPVSISDIAFSAQTRVRFKLMTPFPHVETVNVQLLDVPDIDAIAQLLGDSVFNWEIFAIPGVMSLIKQMARKYMGPILLPPFSLQLNIPQLVSGSALSIGVLEITIKDAKDLKRSSGFLSASVDPYLSIELQDKVVGNTRTVRDTLNPVWNETIHILLPSFTDPLAIAVYDKRESLKDHVMGRIQYNLNSLHDNNYQRNLNATFRKNSKPVGSLNFDLQFFPTLEAKKLPDGTVEDLPDLNTGIAKVIIEEAQGLDEPGKKVGAYVELYMGTKLVLTTSKVTSTEELKFNQEYEAIIMDRRKTRYKLVVKDTSGKIISSTVQTLNDLIDRTEIDKKQIPLKDGKGQLKVTTYWKPVALNLGSNTIAYTPPIGVVRVFFNKATDLMNLEKIGKIDPYAKVLVNGISKGRTDQKSQTLNPVWNQAIYVAVTSPNQRISVECMDVETANKDRSVGKFDIKTQDLFNKGSDDKYVEHVDNQVKSGRLVTKKGAKGSISYYTSFYPAVPVLSLEEIQDVDKINKRRAKLNKCKSMVDEKSMSAEEKQKIKQEGQEIEELEDMYGNKMKLDLDELLQYNSGVLALSFLDGELPQPGCFVQAFFDGNGYARFLSPKIATRTVNTGWTGDVMIKELEWSVTTIRVTKNKYANKAEDCFCEVTIPTLELVRNCYYKPSILSLSGSSSGRLMVQASWFPVAASTLPQSDLITNSGDLSITVKSAENLISADRNGHSDPLVKLYLNDESDAFFKTKTQKKTLDPVWNETTKVQINNRVNERIRIKVMDWDAGNPDDEIGNAILPLSKVDPDNNNCEIDVPLKAKNGKDDGGVLHLQFEFSPRYTMSVQKQETKVGDLASRGLKAGTSVVGAGLGTGVKAGTTVVGAGLGTIGSVGKFGKGLFGGKKKQETEYNAPE